MTTDNMIGTVERFLSKHIYCTLATCSKGTPLATVVVYVSQGLDLYFFTGESTKKLRDIEGNPKVAVSVEGRRLLFFPQAVEIQGRATVLSGAEAKDAQRLYFARHRPEVWAARRVAWMSSIRWVKVRPTRVFTYGIGTRPWQLDPGKQLRRVI